MTPRALLVTLLAPGLAVEAQLIIKAFEVDRYGESLFFPNSDDWRKRHGGSS